MDELQRVLERQSGAREQRPRLPQPSRRTNGLERHPSHIRTKEAGRRSRDASCASQSAQGI